MTEQQNPAMDQHLSLASWREGVTDSLPIFVFRYLPLCLHARKHAPVIKRGITGLLPNNIGMASICALLVVSSLFDIFIHHDRLVPTLMGFGFLSMAFYFTRSIIFSTLF